MLKKIEITGEIEVVTGMHIGGSSAFAAIGAVDSPIIRDVTLNLPMIPGSSLKGKIRTLLAKEYNLTVASIPDNDDERITRLFGCAKKGAVKKSRVIFSDMILANNDKLSNKGIQNGIEIKSENTINRATAVANPRQIERAVRGSVFNMDLIYEVEDDKQLIEDMKTLGEGFRLLQYDYLGGNGSRGYGKVKFNDLLAEVVVGEVSDELMDECNRILVDSVNS